MTNLVLRNARIWTGNTAAPWGGDAALVRDGRLAFVGREHDLSAPPDSETIDVGGRLVLPGLADGHAHLLGTGQAMSSVDLKDATSAEDAARRVGERARTTPGGAWISGAGWDQHGWPRAAFPHRRVLDEVAPANPVVLRHTSGHCVWANSAALRAAGVTAATEAPFGGAIDLDDEGELSGILRDAAMRLVDAAMPPPAASDRERLVRDAVAHANRLGLTCVHAMNVGRGELRALRSLHEAGELTLRVRAFLSADRLDDWEGVERTGDGDDVLRIGGVKFFADGALGSMTAWLFDPYEGTADTGLALQTPDELEARVHRSLDNGLAPAIHAIGDRANRETLDILERAQAKAPSLPRRIEHAQLLAPADIPRFGALGVTASAQPIHATQDMAKVDRAWGARGAGAYAFASLAGTGANLAFGSDSPVETMDPIAGIHAAVTRRNAAGQPEGGWYPGERISLEAAIAAYTRGCAAAVAEETTLGQIAPSYHADFVMLSHDLFALDPMRLLDARAVMTIVGGDVVWRAV